MDIAKGRTAVISTESTYEESSKEPKIPDWASYADKSIEDFSFSPSKTTIENPSVLSIFPGGAECSSGSMVDDEHLQWYGRWLDRQFEYSPHFTKRLRSFTSFFEIAALAKAGCSIDEIATCLLDLDLVEEEDEENRRQVARAFVFTVLGWQTMLYQAAFGTCPPQQFVISDVLDGYTGQAFMTLKQDQSTVKRSLPEFLVGFGLMLPRENLCISDDPEECLAFERVSITSPDMFNAALLQSLARINFKWVDVMAPHLNLTRRQTPYFYFAIRLPVWRISRLKEIRMSEV